MGAVVFFARVQRIYCLFDLLQLVLRRRTASMGRKIPSASSSSHYFVSLASNRQYLHFTLAGSGSTLLSLIGLAALIRGVNPNG